MAGKLQKSGRRGCDGQRREELPSRKGGGASKGDSRSCRQNSTLGEPGCKITYGLRFESLGKTPLL
jgi:hypothetical protein